jgi:hypothetical protein
MGKFFITESEKRNIQQMYGVQKHHAVLETITDETSDFVIKEWLSPDENFCIFLDELYDIRNKTKLGNIFENFENFRFFLKHSFESVSGIPKQIKESVLNDLDKLVITESIQDISFLKESVREIIKENWLGDAWDATKNAVKGFGDWTVKKGEEAVSGVKTFVSKAYSGGKQLVSAISNGEWTKILDIIGKGVIYLARSIRSAMYHPVGMILDGILVASGIGKSVQWIPWAIIVALDIYEIATNNYEEEMPLWLRILMVGCDALGLVVAGVTAVGARKAIQTGTAGLKSTEQLAAAMAKNPELKSTIITMEKNIDKVPGFLQKAIDYLKPRFPSGAKFIEGIMGNVSSFIQKVKSSLPTVAGTKQFAKVAGKETLKTAGIVYGLETGIKKGAQMYYGIGDDEMKLAELSQPSIKNYEEKYGSFADGWG